MMCNQPSIEAEADFSQNYQKASEKFFNQNMETVSQVLASFSHLWNATVA